MKDDNSKTVHDAEQPLLMRQSKKARQLGVCPSTLKGWVEKGILEPPLVINGRSYHSPSTRPKTTAAA